MKIRPYITFDGECNEALELYKRAFKTDTLQVMRFSDLPPNPTVTIPKEYENRIVQATLKLGDNFIRMSDCGPQQSLDAPKSERVTIAAEMSADQVKYAFDVLAEQGCVTMPLEKTFYSPAAGDVVDKFGVIWRLVAQDVSQTTGAEMDFVVLDSIKALELYESIFEVQRVEITGFEIGKNEAVFTMYGARFHMLDENPAYQLIAPKPGDPKPVWVNIVVPDIKETYGRAIAAGCAEVQLVTEMEAFGISNAMFSDPFGYLWMLHQIHREVSFEERCRIMEQS